MTSALRQIDISVIDPSSLTCNNLNVFDIDLEDKFDDIPENPRIIIESIEVINDEHTNLSQSSNEQSNWSQSNWSQTSDEPTSEYSDYSESSQVFDFPSLPQETHVASPSTNEDIHDNEVK